MRPFFMKQAKSIPELLPGDYLLTFSGKWWDWRRARIEIYTGEGYCYASKPIGGVNRYPCNLQAISRILRPNKPFDLELGKKWCFANAFGKKMSDVEFAARFGWASRLDPINHRVEAESVQLSDFLSSPVFDWIY